jgi:hypothetical protein
MDWINVAQDRNQWKVIVNMIMNFGFHNILGSESVALKLAASQEGLSSMKLVSGERK